MKTGILGIPFWHQSIDHLTITSVVCTNSSNKRYSGCATDNATNNYPSNLSINSYFYKWQKTVRLFDNFTSNVWHDVNVKILCISFINPGVKHLTGILVYLETTNYIYPRESNWYPHYFLVKILVRGRALSMIAIFGSFWWRCPPSLLRSESAIA